MENDKGQIPGVSRTFLVWEGASVLRGEQIFQLWYRNVLHWAFWRYFLDSHGCTMGSQIIVRWPSESDEPQQCFWANLGEGPNSYCRLVFDRIIRPLEIFWDTLKPFLIAAMMRMP